MIEPKEKYTIIHPKEDNGDQVKHSLILVLGRALGTRIGSDETVESRMMHAAASLDGIDTINLLGRYSIGLTIARTFDADEVITELKRRLDEDVLSDIVRPKLVTP